MGFDGCDPGANAWIEQHFHDCIYNTRDFVSFVLGLTSIVAWVVAQMPQFISNIRNGSAEALSVWFLAQWFLGDTLNLLGCLIQGQQLPTTTYLAMYFTLSDVIMLLQFMYLTALQKRQERLRQKSFAERQARRRSRRHRSQHPHRDMQQLEAAERGQGPPPPGAPGGLQDGPGGDNGREHRKKSRRHHSQRGPSEQRQERQPGSTQQQQGSQTQNGLEYNKKGRADGQQPAQQGFAPPLLSLPWSTDLAPEQSSEPSAGRGQLGQQVPHLAAQLQLLLPSSVGHAAPLAPSDALPDERSCAQPRLTRHLGSEFCGAGACTKPCGTTLGCTAPGVADKGTLLQPQQQWQPKQQQPSSHGSTTAGLCLAAYHSTAHASGCAYRSNKCIAGSDDSCTAANADRGIESCSGNCSASESCTVRGHGLQGEQGQASHGQAEAAVAAESEQGRPQQQGEQQRQEQQEQQPLGQQQRQRGQRWQAHTSGHSTGSCSEELMVRTVHFPGRDAGAVACSILRPLDSYPAESCQLHNNYSTRLAQHEHYACGLASGAGRAAPEHHPRYEHNAYDVNSTAGDAVSRHQLQLPGTFPALPAGQCRAQDAVRTINAALCEARTHSSIEDSGSTGSIVLPYLQLPGILAACACLVTVVTVASVASFPLTSTQPHTSGGGRPWLAGSHPAIPHFSRLDPHVAIPGVWQDMATTSAHASQASGAAWGWWGMGAQSHAGVASQWSFAMPSALFGPGSMFGEMPGCKGYNEDDEGDYNAHGSGDSPWWCDTNFMTMVAGTALGYASTCMYLSARASQIYKNAKRGTAEGLSLAMFCLAMTGNLCTGISIVLRLRAWETLKAQLPWIFGTFGTVGLDLVIAFQTVSFQRRQHRKACHQSTDDANGLRVSFLQG